MRHKAKDDDPSLATPPARVSRVVAGWIIIAVSLGIAATFFTSRPQPAIGQTGPALTPAVPTPQPPPENLEVFVGPLTHGAQAYDQSRTDIRLLEVFTRESTASHRRLSPGTPSAADRFIEATQGGQPIIGVQISIGATGRGTLPGSLTRAQLARICFPEWTRPPGVDLASLVVNPGRLVSARLDRRSVCVEFVFSEPGTFVVGTDTKPVVPEFGAFYAATGGAATWGPCLTHGFFATVGRAGTVVETSTGSGAYIQVCANGVLGYHPELLGTGLEIQPVLATHWVRGEQGMFVGADPPVANTGAGRYFPQTGHNVDGPFLTKFLALGGAEVLGYPITEALPAAPGFTDQYFQHLKLRMNDASGEISIRPVGREFIAMLAANRHDAAESP